MRIWSGVADVPVAEVTYAGCSGDVVWLLELLGLGGGERILGGRVEGSDLYE